MIQEVVIQMSKIKVLIYINNNGMKKNIVYFDILMYGGAYRQDEVNKLLEFVQARNYFLHIENKNYEEVIKNMKKVQEACFGCVDVLRKYHSNETDLKAWAYHEKLFDEMMQKK